MDNAEAQEELARIMAAEQPRGKGVEAKLADRLEPARGECRQDGYDPTDRGLGDAGRQGGSLSIVGVRGAADGAQGPWMT
jgi:hypothetical protein